MSIALFLKNNLSNIPPGIGKIINVIPYQIRPGLGKVYQKRKSEIEQLANSDRISKQKFIFENIKKLVEHAYYNTQFYRQYYDSQGFNPEMLRKFEDIKKIPVITKAILNKWDIEDRSHIHPGRYLVNTGGSSGTPFGFYIQPDSMGHEWAHMHTIWKKLGYKHTDLKIVFGGRSDVKNAVEYDVVRNHFAVDIYADYKIVAKELKKILQKYNIKYLHGYPSSIYDFALYCEKEDVELNNLLKGKLAGAFLGSEYPHKHYRDKIENVFGIKTISWYGHTERAVLAYEKNEHFTYEPFLSYGFAEVLPNSDNGLDLIATSYYNYASPLIRYNTEDTVESPVIDNGILESFKILKGREGEFIVDRTGKKINLTALIFGRHHQLFNHSDFIQVQQKESGIINVLFVSKNKLENPETLFDTNNLDFDIKFMQIEEPVKTISGKVNLLVK